MLSGTALGKDCSQDEEEGVGLCAEGILGTARWKMGILSGNEIQDEGMHEACQAGEHRAKECYDGDALQAIHSVK